MSIGRILQIVGAIIIFCGLIAGLSQWPEEVKGTSAYYEAQARDIRDSRQYGRTGNREEIMLAEYEARKVVAIYYLVGGLLSGLCFIGFGELVERNTLMEKKMTEKYNKEDEDFSRKCPFCAEMIKKEAIVCRFCNRDVEPIEMEKPSEQVNVQAAELCKKCGEKLKYNEFKCSNCGEHIYNV